MNLKQLSSVIGISATTISRALNGYPEVNINTRKRVEEAAKKYGYSPSSVARRLAGRRVEAVGIVQPVDICMSSSLVFMEMVNVLSSSLRKGNIDLFVFPSGGNDEAKLYQRMITGGRVDSFLVETTKRFEPRIEWLLQKNIPFLSFGRSQVEGNYSWFDIDHRGGLYQACEALLTRGHRRIAYMHQDESLNAYWERLQGFKKAINEVPGSEGSVIENCISDDTAYAKTLALLNWGYDKRPSAIICSNMYSAKGVVRAIEEKGLQLGSDISVIAWDDGIAELTIPGMSVVNAPIRGGSERVAELLLKSINDVDKNLYQELQEVELQLGSSVGAYN